MPLSADGATSLSLGGEARVTYERFGNQNFDPTPPDPDGYSYSAICSTPPCGAGSRARLDRIQLRPRGPVRSADVRLGSSRESFRQR